MTRWLCKAALLAAAVVLPASAAMATLPMIGSSTAPALIPLVTRDAFNNKDNIGFGAQSPAFTVSVRDQGNNPISGVAVVIDLSRNTDLELCDDQLDVDALVNCGAKTMRKFTNALGSVTFTVMGGGKGAAFAPTGLNGGRIFANGTLIKSPTIATCDLNGINAVDPFDKVILLTDINTFPVLTAGRSDLNGDNAVNAFDLSVWLTHLNGPFGASSGGHSCEALGDCP